MSLNDSFDDLLPGKFLGKGDVENGPMTVTIKDYSKGTVPGKEGAAPEPASFIHFEETDRRMIVKPNTLEALKEAFPGGRSASIGGKVELYLDKSVMFGGKKIGGLRLRKPTGSAAAPF
jgi:hypothetical protein